MHTVGKRARDCTGVNEEKGKKKRCIKWFELWVAIQLAKKPVRWPFRCLLRRIFRRISGVKSSWAMV